MTAVAKSWRTPELHAGEVTIGPRQFVFCQLSLAFWCSIPARISGRLFGCLIGPRSHSSRD